MPDHELRPVGDELAGGGSALVGVAGIVDHDQVQILAQNPPGGVDHVGGPVGANLLLFPNREGAPGERPANPDHDLCPCGRSQKQQETQDTQELAPYPHR